LHQDLAEARQKIAKLQVEVARSARPHTPTEQRSPQATRPISLAEMDSVSVVSRAESHVSSSPPARIATQDLEESFSTFGKENVGTFSSIEKDLDHRELASKVGSRVYGMQVKELLPGCMQNVAGVAVFPPRCDELLRGTNLISASYIPMNVVQLAVARQEIKIVSEELAAAQEHARRIDFDRIQDKEEARIALAESEQAFQETFKSMQEEFDNEKSVIWKKYQEVSSENMRLMHEIQISQRDLETIQITVNKVSAPARDLACTFLRSCM